MRNVVDVLTDLPADDVEEHKQFLESRLSILYQANDHSELIGQLSMNMNYLSYHLLEYLAGEFNLKDVKEKIEVYKSHLQNFRMRTSLIMFCKSQKRHQEPPPDFKKFVVNFQWPEDMNTVTLEEVEEFRQKYAYQYRLRDFALMIVGFRRGCVIVTWFIPESIVEKLKVNMPINVFHKHNVAKVEIAGTCIYDTYHFQQVCALMY